MSHKKSDSPGEFSFDTANFIHHIIDQDNLSGKWGGKVITRFPPEPNGFAHIGHAKSICLNFGTAKKYQGRCHLRFDDTNPANESEEFVHAFKRDVSWLGFSWGEHLYHASDYFERLYMAAEQLIQADLAYVCSLSPDQVKSYRGTLTEPGLGSPDRNRPREQSLDLFRRMRAGEFPDGAYTLRAKIDMASPNINMRDPAIYRIKRHHHQRTGDKWCIYPMYDYTHCLSDSFENITHSLCTLEFENHRPLYDWFIEKLGLPCHPQQIEFAPLNLSYVLTSKRRLKRLVQENHVEGWDDPRLPTLAGMRRRGYPPAAIRNFCEMIGVSKKETVIDYAVLEQCVRDELNETSKRVMAVLKPLRVTITNLPEAERIEISVPNHPQVPEMGRRLLHFSRTLYIEQEDFLEQADKDFFRLTLGGQVRLRYGFVLTCHDIKKNAKGELEELMCTYHPETLGGKPLADGRKVKGIIHWIGHSDSFSADVILYDRLFKTADPRHGENEGSDFIANLADDSRQLLASSRLELSLRTAKAGESFQFERSGYFVCDEAGEQPRFIRTVDLKSLVKK